MINENLSPVEKVKEKVSEILYLCHNESYSLCECGEEVKEDSFDREEALSNIIRFLEENYELTPKGKTK